MRSRVPANTTKSGAALAAAKMNPMMRTLPAFSGLKEPMIRSGMVKARSPPKMENSIRYVVTDQGGKTYAEIDEVAGLEKLGYPLGDNGFVRCIVHGFSP